MLSYLSAIRPYPQGNHKGANATRHADVRDRLTAAIERRSGAQAAALDHDMGFDIGG